MKSLATDHDPGATVSKRQLFGHPLGLYALFFTETWERFSFYGMRVLLVLYMADHLFKRDLSGVIGLNPLKAVLEAMKGPLGPQPLASMIYGLYTSLVYLTPIFGGYIADRYLGQRKTVVVGGVLMAIGHFLMAYEPFFLFALLFIIAGNGMFKPNLSTQVGALYPKGDPRRDNAYNIYYMGINLGALFSPLICGTLGQLYGWHYGFGAAGVGMVIGLIVYILSQGLLAPDDFTRRKAEHEEVKPLTRNEWKAVIGLIALGVLNIPFWAVYEQQGNTMQLFADRSTDWEIFGWQMPSTWFQVFNPMFIFIMGPLINTLWTWQARKKIHQTSIMKMAMGCALLGLGFWVLIPITSNLGDGGRIHFLWLVAAAYVFTMGELYLSPVGLSVVTKISPPRIVGLMMGAWFLSAFIGNFIAGILGTYYELMKKSDFFLLLGGIAIAAGLLIVALNGPLKKVCGEDV